MPTERKGWNHNLLVTYVHRVTFSVTQGMWNSGTGSNYIFYLEGQSNTLVGLIQGIQGLCIPLGSFPGGYIADRTRRDLVLKAFGITGFIAMALISSAVLAPKVYLSILPSVDIKYLLLCAGYSFWGITQASSSIVESILADSVPTGARSAVYTSLFFLTMLGRAVGPLFAALVFVIDGNQWKVSTLGKAMLAGMAGSLIPILALFFFNDDRSLGLESEAHSRGAADSEQGADTCRDGVEDGKARERHRERPRLWCLGESSIPYILSCSDIIYGLASGCTIKFFPIFFAKEVQLSPVAVNILMAAQPVAIGFCAHFAQWLSRYLGRIQVMLLLRLIGFSSMAVMGIFTSFWANSPLIIFIFLLRTGVNNAGYPIQKAVLMDYVPKKSRGKWSAVDSIASFGWSGSAFLGGIMVDHAGFDTCFLITALAQCCGWAVLFPLLALVPRREVSKDAPIGVTAPLLGGEGDTEQGQQSASGSLPAQQQACAEGCDGIDRPEDPPGQSQLVINTTGGPEGSRQGMEEEEFVKLIGSLKSPRRSIDTWPRV